MNTERNRLKAALAEGAVQIGLWSSLCSPLVAEVIAGAGFDWILLDTEHAPNDLPQIVMQLQAVSAFEVEPVVRIPSADATIIKRFLDAGARSLLIPMVEDAEAARRIVAATRYPPQGIRGVSVANRANRFGRARNYLHEASANICLVVQIETQRALSNLEHIASVEGIDALFVGPSDLAANLGHLGNPTHPEAQEAIHDAIRRCVKNKRPIGILAPDPEAAWRYLNAGATYVAVGSDLGILARGSDALADAFRVARDGRTAAAGVPPPQLDA